MEDFKAQVKDYLKCQVDPVIKPLLDQILKQKPKDVVCFIRDHMNKILKKRQCSTHQDSSDDQIDQHQVNLMIQKRKMLKKGQKKMSGRQGISAQAFGAFNKKQQYTCKIIEKDEMTKHRIKSLIQNSILFQSLNKQEFRVVIDAMEQIEVKTGQNIINEGERGDSLFIIDSGQYECYKIINKKSTYLKTYKSGEFFGELALMYNSPRAATITCKTSGKVFGLDRMTFTKIVQESATKKRQTFLNIISKVDILSQIDPYQKQQLCDSLKDEEYLAGSYLVKQGEEGDKFYIVAQGNLEAIKTTHQGQSQKVYEYKAGDYFGEIALIKDTVRQASIRASTDCRVVSIERDAFKRLLGPLQNILQRNMQKYKKFVIE